ncbi:Hsp20/alpha crystallin family protein [Ferruginibacter albus]|uniref:Hsp20/alpha crystallin family protein n=1 Tax=Ferruginibacter albus TaxID=2875540 RepID=UPI001CC764E9|nr:Hsp20/alpha crystallin family protein [Ferruginibacter albus]UAY53064.1 Hsp20/alpha crystallin family protein [Ferruginibacter albus]
MNNLIKRKQDNQPATFGNVIDDIFQNNLNRFFSDDFWGFSGLNSQSNVPVNIEETDNSYEVELVAPGLQKKDFNISINNDILTIGFKQHEENKQENKKWITQQYRQQEFTRTFALDKTVNTEKITANYENGILKISIPKNEQAKKVSRLIEIQ